MNLLNASIKSYIPDMEIPVNLKRDEKDYYPINEKEKYALLDFIEYCYSKIIDIEEKDYDYHTFYLRNLSLFPSKTNKSKVIITYSSLKHK